LKIRIGFAGEAGDEGGSQRQAVDARSQTAKKVFCFGARDAAAHAAEHGVAGVLQRNVDVGQNFAAVGDRIDERIVDVHRIEVHQANPVDAGDLLKLAEQMSQPRLAIEIEAV